MARHLALVLLSTATVALGACGTKPPTQPTVEGPRILGITPERPIASEAPQPLTIRGEQFSTTLIFLTVAPDGATSSYSGSALESVTPSSFQVRALLPRAGTYTFIVRSGTNSDSTSTQIVVTNPAGGTSNTVSLLVSQ